MSDPYLWVYRNNGQPPFSSYINDLKQSLVGFASLPEEKQHEALWAALMEIHQRYRRVPDLSLFGRFQKLKEDMRVLGTMLLHTGSIAAYVPHVYLWPDSNYIDVGIQYILPNGDFLHRITVSKLSPSQQAERQ